MSIQELDGLKVSLIDENKIEVFSFSGEMVTATLGTHDGAVCAPLLNLEINRQNSVTIYGQGFDIVWTNIEVGKVEISVLRNGTPAKYRIE